MSQGSTAYLVIDLRIPQTYHTYIQLSLANATMGSTGTSLQFQDPVTVRVSHKERVSGRMTEEHIAAAVIAFHRDGFVVLENVVDPEHCAVLDKEMCKTADRMKTDPKTIWNDVSTLPPL